MLQDERQFFSLHIREIIVRMLSVISHDPTSTDMCVRVVRLSSQYGSVHGYSTFIAAWYLDALVTWLMPSIRSASAVHSAVRFRMRKMVGDREYSYRTFIDCAGFLEDGPRHVDIGPSVLHRYIHNSFSRKPPTCLPTMIVAERGVQMELLLSVSGGMKLDMRARGERVCEGGSRGST